MRSPEMAISGVGFLYEKATSMKGYEPGSRGASSSGRHYPAVK
jgi:hypothetical protein